MATRCLAWHSNGLYFPPAETFGFSAAISLYVSSSNETLMGPPSNQSPYSFISRIDTHLFYLNLEAQWGNLALNYLSIPTAPRRLSPARGLPNSNWVRIPCPSSQSDDMTSSSRKIEKLTRLQVQLLPVSICYPRMWLNLVSALYCYYSIWTSYIYNIKSNYAWML